jgi:hypothetical protein
MQFCYYCELVFLFVKQNSIRIYINLARNVNQIPFVNVFSVLSASRRCHVCFETKANQFSLNKGILQIISV